MLIMKKSMFGAVAVLCLLGGPAWAADALKPEVLLECMLTNSTDEHEKVLSGMFVAALAGTDEELRASFDESSKMMLGLAMNTCQVTEADLQSEAAAQAFSAYGEQLGQRVMGKAMARLGM
jgi:hypothetical protein